MNRSTFAIMAAVALFTISCSANGEPKSLKTHPAKLNLGGRVMKPGSVSGRIVILDTQSGFASNQIQNAVRKLTNIDAYRVDVIKGTDKADISQVMRTQSANVLIRIVDLPDQPVITVASEEYWCTLNVRSLHRGLASDAPSQAIFNARCRKELQRAFAFVCGGMLSQYPNNLSSITDLKALDSAAEELPMDLRDRIKRNLGQIGVKPAQVKPYFFACQEGWAPAPTNEVQKTIWDKVHKLPTEPIKIKPETKKVEK